MSTKIMTTCVEKRHLRLNALHARYADDIASLYGVIERELAMRVKEAQRWDKQSDLHAIRWQLCVLAAWLLNSDPETINEVCDECREARIAAGNE